MKSPFALLETLSSRLKLRKKFQLLFLVAILPGTAILISSAIYRSDAIAFTHQEISGVEAFRVVNKGFSISSSGFVHIICPMELMLQRIQISPHSVNSAVCFGDMAGRNCTVLRCWD